MAPFSLLLSRHWQAGPREWYGFSRTTTVCTTQTTFLPKHSFAHPSLNSEKKNVTLLCCYVPGSGNRYTTGEQQAAENKAETNPPAPFSRSPAFGGDSLSLSPSLPSLPLPPPSLSIRLTIEEAHFRIFISLCLSPSLCLAQRKHSGTATYAPTHDKKRNRKTTIPTFSSPAFPICLRTTSSTPLLSCRLSPIRRHRRRREIKTHDTHTRQAAQ